MIGFAWISTILFTAITCTTCPGSVEAVCKAEADCDWVPGSCGPLVPADCSSVDSCIVGCDYVEGKNGTCVDTIATECAAESNCADNENCEEKDGYCAPDDDYCSEYKGDQHQGCSSYSSGCFDGNRVVECVDLNDLNAPVNECMFFTGRYGTICADFSDERCMVSGESCVSVHNLDEMCSNMCANEVGGGCINDLFCAEMCKANGSQCVSAEDEESSYCAGLSVKQMPECEFHLDVCKIDVTGGCVGLTNEEKCARRSIAPDYSACTDPYMQDVRACRVNAAGTACEPINPEGYDQCSGLSIDKVYSFCEILHNPACVVDMDTGKCIKYTPTCRLTLDKQRCDDASRYQGCIENITTECKASADYCGTEIYEHSCEDKFGCKWVRNPICKRSSSSPCVKDGDGSCLTKPTPTGCSSTAAEPASCSLINTVSTCGEKLNNNSCGSVDGCKWQWTVGGNCVSKTKTCGSERDYATCCKDPSSTTCDNFCGGNPKPAGCPACATSFGACCGSDPSCAYCQGSPKPPDCPVPTCNTQPSYDLCCASSASSSSCLSYCSGSPAPSDCPSAACLASPSYANCGCATNPSCLYCQLNPAADECKKGGDDDDSAVAVKPLSSLVLLLLLLISFL